MSPATINLAVANKAGQPDGFEAWFSQSKVVRPDGSPCVVYHGTNADVSCFDPAMMGTSVDNPTTRFGFYFSADPDDAGNWASRAVRRGMQSIPNIIPVYLRIENPVYLNAEKFLYYLQKARVRTIDSHLAAWKKKGHDGIVAVRGEKQWFVAFSPTQIKSAIGNSGAYDLNDPEITDRKALGLKALAFVSNAPFHAVVLRRKLP